MVMAGMVNQGKPLKGRKMNKLKPIISIVAIMAILAGSSSTASGQIAGLDVDPSVWDAWDVPDTASASYNSSASGANSEYVYSYGYVAPESDSSASASGANSEYVYSYGYVAPESDSSASASGSDYPFSSSGAYVPESDSSASASASGSDYPFSSSGAYVPESSAVNHNAQYVHSYYYTSPVVEVPETVLSPAYNNGNFDPNAYTVTQPVAPAAQAQAPAAQAPAAQVPAAPAASYNPANGVKAQIDPSSLNEITSLNFNLPEGSAAYVGDCGVGVSGGYIVSDTQSYSFCITDTWPEMLRYHSSVDLVSVAWARYLADDPGMFTGHPLVGSNDATLVAACSQAIIRGWSNLDTNGSGRGPCSEGIVEISHEVAEKMCADVTSGECEIYNKENPSTMHVADAAAEEAQAAMKLAYQSLPEDDGGYAEIFGY